MVGAGDGPGRSGTFVTMALHGKAHEQREFAERLFLLAGGGGMPSGAAAPNAARRIVRTGRLPGQSTYRKIGLDQANSENKSVILLSKSLYVIIYEC
jgi:hypothetical protein